MQASVKYVVASVSVAVLAAALMLIGPAAGSAPTAPAPQCGIAAWTGTCACVAGPHSAPVSFETFARSLESSGRAAALDQARRQCGMAASPG